MSDTEQQTTSLSPVTDSAANWETYRNDKFSFELKYPPDLTVEEQTGSIPQIGDDWVRVIFRDKNNDFGLIFFAGRSSMGAAGEGYSAFQTKNIIIAGKQTKQFLAAPKDGSSEDVLLSAYTQHFENRSDNFYSSFKRPQIAAFVPRIESIISTFKYMDAAQSTIQIQLLKLTAQDQNLLPVLHYRVSGQINGNTYINVISKSSGTTLWGKEDGISYPVIDFGGLTGFDGLPVKVSNGDYFLRLQDWYSGTTLAESATFHIEPGVIDNY